MKPHHALVAIVLVASLIGLLFMGLAASDGWRAGDAWSMTRHPLFSSGAAVLAAAAACGVLLLRFGRGH